MHRLHQELDTKTILVQMAFRREHSLIGAPRNLHARGPIANIRHCGLCGLPAAQAQPNIAVP
jgi:hypothetical protein